jgi:hypothetical protein
MASNLSADAVQSAPAMPNELCAKSPPRIAPMTSMTGAPTLRFRSALCSPNRSGSEKRSQYMLVKTTLVRLLYFKALLVTAWPQLWKAIKAMGTRTFQPISSLDSTVGPNVTIEAATIVSSIWSRNEAQSTHRRFGEKYRWKRLKRKEPRQKQPSEVLDLIHRVDSRGAARPRPM